MVKYVLVTGGVISGVGKGIIASSIGAILKAYDLTLTAIKIDPYLNIDAGTFSPYEHGEVFVLADGGEVDLDLGNYERFLDVTLGRENNITTGKIYQQVIERERRGDYLGKTVQVIPHITDCIQEWIERVSKHLEGSPEEPDVCIIELGGVVGDIESMPYVEAFRQFQFKVGQSNFCVVHVGLLPESKGGELKTKPMQISVRELRGLGLSPDLIMCRSASNADEPTKEKISMFCHVKPELVISIPDAPSTYRVPLMLEEQHVAEFLVKRLSLPRCSATHRKMFLKKWTNLTHRHEYNWEEVRIALVGKYIKFEDAYLSVVKALSHSAAYVKRKLIIKWVNAEALEAECKLTDPVKYHDAWQNLCSSDGVLIPGGFGNRGIEGKIAAAEWARTSKKPLLGICLGLQVCVIEFARNVLGYKDAQSAEFAPKCTHQVVIEMPEFNPGNKGGTMRLGLRKTVFVKEESVTRTLYGNVPVIEERHRHRYEVNLEHVPALEKGGVQFVGKDVEGVRMEVMELQGHPFYIAVQFHPEFTSRPLKPSPPYLGLVLASAGLLDTYLCSNRNWSPNRSLNCSESELSDDELQPLSSTGVSC